MLITQSAVNSKYITTQLLSNSIVIYSLGDIILNGESGGNLVGS